MTASIRKVGEQSRDYLSKMFNNEGNRHLVSKLVSKFIEIL